MVGLKFLEQRSVCSSVHFTLFFTGAGRGESKTVVAHGMRCHFQADRLRAIILTFDVGITLHHFTRKSCLILSYLTASDKSMFQNCIWLRRPCLEYIKAVCAAVSFQVGEGEGLLVLPVHYVEPKGESATTIDIDRQRRCCRSVALTKAFCFFLSRSLSGHRILYRYGRYRWEYNYYILWSCLIGTVLALQNLVKLQTFSRYLDKLFCFLFRFKIFVKTG